MRPTAKTRIDIVVALDQARIRIIVVRAHVPNRVYVPFAHNEPAASRFRMND